MTELYVELKQLTAEELRLARDALHIYGGFFIFVAIERRLVARGVEMPRITDRRHGDRRE